MLCQNKSGFFNGYRSDIKRVLVTTFIFKYHGSEFSYICLSKLTLNQKTDAPYHVKDCLKSNDVYYHRRARSVVVSDLPSESNGSRLLAMCKVRSLQ